MPEAMEIETPAKKAEEEKPPPDSAALYRADCKLMASAVERFVAVREARFATAALRLMAVLRSAGRSSPAVTGPVLAAFVSASFSASHPLRERLLAALPPPAVEAEPVAANSKSPEGAGEPKKRPLLPEMELLLEILVLQSLIDGTPLVTSPFRELPREPPLAPPAFPPTAPSSPPFPLPGSPLRRRQSGRVAPTGRHGA